MYGNGDRSPTCFALSFLLSVAILAETWLRFAEGRDGIEVVGFKNGGWILLCEQYTLLKVINQMSNSFK